MAQKGKRFESEINKALAAVGNDRPNDFYHMRIYDRAGPATQRQPADFLAIHKRQPYFFECKRCGVSTSFPFNYIRDTQRQDLMKAADAGAISMFIIKHSKGQKPSCYAIDIATWMDIEANSKNRSVRWDVLDRLAEEKSINKIVKNGDVWDLRALFV